jgi:hypothetical protein
MFNLKIHNGLLLFELCNICNRKNITESYLNYNYKRQFND